MSGSPWNFLRFMADRGSRRTTTGRFRFFCTLRSQAPPDVSAAEWFPPFFHISAAIFPPLFRIPTLFQGSVLRKLE